MDISDEMTPEQKREREEFEKAFREVLFTPSGKRVLFWILSECRIYQSAFAGVDAATNYELGKQFIGRRIISEMDGLDPRLYPKLLLDIAEMKAMAAAAASTKSENDDDLDG